MVCSYTNALVFKSDEQDQFRVLGRDKEMARVQWCLSMYGK